MQQPSINRMLHYWPHSSELMEHSGQPCVAIVCHVHTPEVVNVSVCDSVGGWRGRSRVQIIGEGEAAPTNVGYLTWPGVRTLAQAAAAPITDEQAESGK